MRLFIAITFDEPTIRALTTLRERVRVNAQRGHFTRTENLHLTLAFIGETQPERVRVLTRIIDSLPECECPLTIKTLGRFTRNGGDIVWAGFEPSAALTATHRNVTDALAADDFPVETKPYTPHLTLAREAVPLRGVDWRTLSPEHPIETKAKHVSLMLSERVRGTLTYTELHARVMK